MDVEVPVPAPPKDGAEAAPAGASPVMAQYLAIKAAHPDGLLFYRMGDFYELFFADAAIAARALGIALTRRGKHLGEDIPMCGVPVHAADEYLERLIRLGHRVAVCEQIEDPAEARKRGSKSVVRREVVRLVTPGTLTEDRLLDATRHNYLAALARVRGEGALALGWIDISTGDFAATLTREGGLAAELARLEASEIIVPDSLLAEDGLRRMLKEAGCAVTPLPAARFDSAAAERRLQEHFAVVALEVFGELSRAEIAACGALLDYVAITQVGRMPVLTPPRRLRPGAAMLIDAATRANLELIRTFAGARPGSLLAAIDRTATGAGSRLLAERLAAPLTDAAAVNARLDGVTFFVEQGDLRHAARAALRSCPDLARALSRLTVGRGGPRDLAAIRDAMAAAQELARRLCGDTGLLARPELVAGMAAGLGRAEPGLAGSLAAVLGEELPLNARDGGFVRAGHSPELDEQRRLSNESRKVIAGLQARYVEETGIRSLKVRHNNVLGYFVEATAQHGEKLMRPPLNGAYLHRQTLANVVRFTTVELAEVESRIALAAERALGLELEVFDQLVAAVRAAAQELAAVAAALAELDATAALAELAGAERLVRPRVDASLAFRIVQGRHPVVEPALKRHGSAAFVPNDCDLGAEPGEDGAAGRHIWLVTGPNMAGKSTFLRQNALIAVLAQMGSYVPAAEAHIGVVDRLFSRVGAADDLARGRSTFMVEMVETATILNQAGERSLVILDEIGRGTATFDGLSIAWACVEHLHEVNRCRALFATHFHELTALADRLPRIANATMKVREWHGDLVFLHEVAPGAADRSYGIQVAKLAGLPAAALARASEVLAVLEQSRQQKPHADLAGDLPLFAAARPRGPVAAPRGRSEVEEMLGKVLPDELSPRDALDLVYALKAKLC